MSEKNKHGGPNRGQGRKMKDPQRGERITMSFRFFPETAAELRAHQLPATALVERGLAITLPALGHATPGTDECLLAYHAVSNALITLEARRDSGAEDEFAWSPEEASLHALLSDFWDKLRDERTFWEPELPE